jgi:hypothetical protein
MLQGGCDKHTPGQHMSERPGGDRECPAFARRRRIYADMLATAPAPPVDGWQAIETISDANVIVPRQWLQGVWNMANDALKRLPADPQGALVSLTGALMALHAVMPQPPNNERTG